MQNPDQANNSDPFGSGSATLLLSQSAHPTLLGTGTLLITCGWEKGTGKLSLEGTYLPSQPTRQVRLTPGKGGALLGLTY